MEQKKKTTSVGKISILLLAILCSSNYWGQVITSGKITFERRTNLIKKMGDPRMSDRIPKDQRIVKENFLLTFNEKKSSFKPIIDDNPEERGWVKWLTTQNTYYQDLGKNEQVLLLSFVGKVVPIVDSLPVRNWKITNKKRTIGGYECRRAIYEKNDSTRIYAWFSDEIAPSVGPEGFCGLPGTILGIATEDGGIVYFASKIEATKVNKEEFKYDLGKKKVFTLKEFKDKIEKEYSNTRWGKGMYNNLFRWL